MKEPEGREGPTRHGCPKTAIEVGNNQVSDGVEDKWQLEH